MRHTQKKDYATCDPRRGPPLPFPPIYPTHRVQRAIFICRTNSLISYGQLTYSSGHDKDTDRFRVHERQGETLGWLKYHMGPGTEFVPLVGLLEERRPCWLVRVWEWLKDLA